MTSPSAQTMLPAIPDDDADFTPDLARKIIARYQDMLRAASAPAAAREELEDRQRVVIEWGERCFGSEHMSDKIVRAARFFEEAAELAQAARLSKGHAQRAFDHVYSRPAGIDAAMSAVRSPVGGSPDAK